MEQREATQGTPRAPRFPLQLCVRYRPIGDTGWREGTTKNISCSGVLFSGGERISPQVECEFRLQLQLKRPAEIVCRGHIVRSSTIDGVQMAATIDQYSFRDSTA